MTTRRTVLNVEQLGARVLPSASLPVTTPAKTTASVSTSTTVHSVTTGSAWTGQGRYTLTTNKTTSAKTYSFQGSAAFANSTFFAISGTITTVGNKAGQATGRIVLSAPKGTLTLTLTGPTQSANSGLPASLTFKVASGSGYFAHYSGTGSFKVSAALFSGYDNAGHFSTTVAAPVTTSTSPTPPVTTTTGPSWTGQGRYTLATVSSTKVKTYTLQGTADFGSSQFFAISGTVQTVGSKAGEATGKVTLSSTKGTLVLSVSGPAQAANSALPAKLTYKVVSGTGFFAHYAGQGSLQMSQQLFIGYDDRGQFSVAVKPTAA
jgi:hypothetical protein